MTSTQSRINQMIREAQTKDFDAEVWRDRQTEWTELNYIDSNWTVEIPGAVTFLFQRKKIS